MKIYFYMIGCLLRYKRYYTWVQTHRIEFVDKMFFYGFMIAIIGLGLMFGSGMGEWAIVGAIGVAMVVVAKFLVSWAEKR